MNLWYENLYLSRDFSDSGRKLLKKAGRGNAVSGIYLIVLSETENAILEILPSQHLAQRYYKDKANNIIGAAESAETAKEMAASIAATVFTSGYGQKFKNLFGDKFEKNPDLKRAVYI